MQQSNVIHAKTVTFAERDSTQVLMQDRIFVSHIFFGGHADVTHTYTSQLRCALGPEMNYKHKFICDTHFQAKTDNINIYNILPVQYVSVQMTGGWVSA